MEKPTQQIVSVGQVVKDVYGACPRCGTLHYVKPNPFRHRPAMRMEIQRLGERGNYLMDWHDVVVNRVVQRGQSCYGSNAVPKSLIKEEPVKDEKKD